MEPGDQTLQDQSITIHSSTHNVNRCRTKSCITNNQTIMSRNPTQPKSIDELNCVFLNADTLTNKMSELHLLTKTERPHMKCSPKTIIAKYTQKNSYQMDTRWLYIPMSIKTLDAELSSMSTIPYHTSRYQYHLIMKNSRRPYLQKSN